MKCISIFIISFFFLMAYGQKDSVQVVDSLKKTEWHLGLGTDLAAPAMNLFSDRSGYSLLVNLQIYRKWFIQSQFGYEQNKYDDIGWKVQAKGSYFKIGANYIITQHRKKPLNQFYIGGKIAFTGFTQDLQQVPIRATGQTTQYVDYGDDKARVYWFELPVGARVSILKDKLFIESIFTTNILLHQESDLDINPVVIPNFGRNNGALNFNLFWGICYFFK